MPECNLDPRASMFPSSPPPASPVLSSTRRPPPPVPLVAPSPPSSRISFEIVTLPSEIRAYAYERIVKRASRPRETAVSTVSYRPRGVFLARIRQRRFCDRQRCALVFLANRTGWRAGGEREDTERGSGEARSIIDSPGTP